STDDKTVKVVTKSEGYSGDVVIPAEVTYKDVTYTVTAIGSAAFNDDTELVSVSLPSTIKTIEHAAFCRSSIQSLTLPDGVTTIASAAFKNCTSLKSVNIPSTVNKIGDFAFYGCSNLEGDIVIPDGVEEIEYQAFYGCSKITSVTIPNSVKSIDHEAFMDCVGLTGTVTIPEGVTSIATHAFYNCTGITEFVLPSTLTEIGSWAFSGCTALESVNLPYGVTTIASAAFKNCASLKSVEIPSTVNKIGDFAFYGCSNLEGDIVIPDGVEEIEYQAFYGCSKITSVTIPNSVTSIDHEAFMDCVGITGKVIIPEGVTSIATHAFYNCTGITEFVLPSTLTEIGSWAFSECTALETVNLPDGLTAIELRAFYGCTSLKSDIVVPEGVTELGYGVFGHCSSLTNVTLPSTLTSIGDLLFYDCSSLESVNIPESVTNIGREAFRDCANLTGIISIPSTMTEIPPRAFYGCTNITEFVIPETVVKIGAYAFGGCTGIESIVVPASVESVGNCAFKDCVNLKEVELGSGLESLGSEAFGGCSSLEKVVSHAAVAPACPSDNTFSDFSAALYVPEAGEASYISALTWRKFFDVVAYSSTTIWTGLADNDWNNIDNWTSLVPSKQISRVAVVTKVGSEVTLTDGTVVTVANYPIITGTRNGSDVSYDNKAVCDTIIFEPGAGVLGLQNLDYNKAFVKARFNLNRWYMISSPLKNMYTGDFYFNGSPITYLSRFKHSVSSEDPSDSHYWFQSCVSLNEALPAGEGFVFKPYRYNGSSSEILDVTFPRTDENGNLYTLLYKFNPLSGKLIMSASQTLERFDNAYRFVVEDDNNKMPSKYSVDLSTAGEYSIVSNPVMTHLDIVSFFNDNSDEIEGKIVIISDDNVNTSIMTDGNSIKSASATTESIIAPLQSFFVKKKSSFTNSVTFDLEKNFTTDNYGTAVLKSSKTQHPALYATADSDGKKSYVSFWLNDKASNGFVYAEDAEKILSANVENEIYSEADGKKLDINQFSSLPYEAPLSVSVSAEGKSEGEINLSFTGAESYENVDVILINKQTNEQVNLKDESSYKFAFDANTAQGSLFIRFQASAEVTTSAAQTIGEDVRIFGAGSKVKVIGSESNKIIEVAVIDAAGRTVSHKKLGGVTEYESDALTGSFVVKAVCENGTKTAKVNIR
ncbi:MAG: leucine-rich repeat domain-containing protein, partial [Paludibacteraceae bacterium]|nr:leucine-rich repeat domain-containing protein [Paludibacteraceae bacterium]